MKQKFCASSWLNTDIKILYHNFTREIFSKITQNTGVTIQIRRRVPPKIGNILVNFFSGKVTIIAVFPMLCYNRHYGHGEVPGVCNGMKIGVILYIFVEMYITISEI